MLIPCAGSQSTSAASEEDTGDIVQRGEQVKNQAEQAPTVRKRGKVIFTTTCGPESGPKSGHLVVYLEICF